MTDLQKNLVTKRTLQENLYVCQVNEENGQIIPYDDFYMAGLSEKVDIPTHYVRWTSRQGKASENDERFELVKSENTSSEGI